MLGQLVNSQNIYNSFKTNLKGQNLKMYKITCDCEMLITIDSL